jgi:penicillin-binding protein 1A
VTGVWLGNDDNAPTKRMTGGGLPVDVWSRFMKTAHLGVAIADLPGLRGSGASLPSAPVAAARPGATQEPARPLPPDGVPLDRWFIDRLFGRR